MDILKHGNKAVYPICYKTDYAGLRSVNCFIYKNGDEYTLIDAGFRAPEYQAFFLEMLANYGIELNQISRILLTHFHADHTGLVKWLANELDLPIYASPLAIPRILHDNIYLKRKVEIYDDLWEVYGLMEYATTRMNKLRETYEERGQLQFDSKIHPLIAGDVVAGLQVLATPGHSPDSISFYDAETGWMFAGDVLLETGLSSVLLEYDEKEQFVSAYVDYFETLAEIERFNPTVIFPGHRHSFSNVSEVIEHTTNKIEYKVKKVIKHVGTGAKTVEQLGLAIYGPRFEPLFTFTSADIIALLQLGEARGLIESEQLNGVYSFKLKV